MPTSSSTEGHGQRNDFGIVIDNRDPSGMNRVKVEFPVEAGFDSMVRIVTPWRARTAAS